MQIANKKLNVDNDKNSYLGQEIINNGIKRGYS